MILVEPGTFTMGSESGEGDEDEEPAHDVELTIAFELGLNEVTEVEWTAHMGSDFEGVTGCDNCAVNYVTRGDALAFLNARSEAEGLPPCYPEELIADPDAVQPYEEAVDCLGYRLPTEAEWEYAARAGSDFAYAGSDDIDDVARTDSLGVVCPRGVNAWGFCDLSGGVAEWVEDSYSADAYASFEGIEDRVIRDPLWGLEATEGVLRGGGYHDPAFDMRVAARAAFQPTTASTNVGLRVARTAD